MQGLLQPIRPVIRKAANGAPGLGQIPTPIGVDHDRIVGSDRIAHGGEALAILRDLRLSYLYLEAVKPGRLHRLGVGHELRLAEPEPTAVGTVDGNARDAVASQDRPERLSGGFRDDVP